MECDKKIKLEFVEEEEKRKCITDGEIFLRK